jgi:hypothetical protein
MLLKILIVSNIPPIDGVSLFFSLIAGWWSASVDGRRESPDVHGALEEVGGIFDVKRPSSALAKKLQSFINYFFVFLHSSMLKINMKKLLTTLGRLKCLYG